MNSGEGGPPPHSQAAQTAFIHSDPPNCLMRNDHEFQCRSTYSPAACNWLRNESISGAIQSMAPITLKATTPFLSTI